MSNQRPVVIAGMALGVGMGGFVDGILFHQLLQFHNMLSARFPTRNLPAEELVINLEVNMFWDGLFHVLSWTMTLIGIVLLWNAMRQPGIHLSSWSLSGAMIAGWGLFNLHFRPRSETGINASIAMSKNCS